MYLSVDQLLIKRKQHKHVVATSKISVKVQHSLKYCGSLIGLKLNLATHW